MYICTYIDIRTNIHMSICEASSHKFKIHLFLEKKIIDIDIQPDQVTILVMTLPIKSEI